MISELKPCEACNGTGEGGLNAVMDIFCRRCKGLGTRAVPDVPELVRYTPVFYDDDFIAAMEESDEGEYVLHSQAAAIIAAKDAEINQLKADKQRLVEDRARFPDRPDDIGRMIEAEIGNRKEAEKQANRFAELYRKRAEAAEAKLASAIDLVSRAQELVPYGCESWHNFAREALGASPAPAASVVAKNATTETDLKAENERLREALRFYADVHKYPSPLTGGMGDLWSDCGEVAKKALKGERNV